jgi:rSAM/selenodomain-associated transferase 2
MLSVVIPTLNAAARLPVCLASLAPAGGIVGEVVVVDGGSVDGTRAAAEAGGARVVDAARGRGRQLAAGAAATHGNWLLFLHADTWLEPGWADEAGAFMASGAAAAAFRFALDDPAPQARRVERLVAWRASVLALPYGDQGLLIPRSLHDEVGGFRPLPLMEDVDLVRRLGRRRLRLLRSRAFTSAERYRRDGWMLRPARNLGCLSLYFLGVPPTFIARLYG